MEIGIMSAPDSSVWWYAHLVERLSDINCSVLCSTIYILPAALKVQHYKYVTKDDYRKSSYYVEMEWRRLLMQPTHQMWKRTSSTPKFNWSNGVEKRNPI